MRFMKNIQMVNLKSQYEKIKEDIDSAVIKTIESTSYINGPTVSEFRIENVEQLCNTVFSLPIHTEIENSSQDFIIQKVKEFFNKI
tara:strand:+ start:276 stop:533 length:258 start_codon:yes stop_codon:yes gene_type:complete